MNKIILSTLATLGLTGGVALAEPHHNDARREVVRDHREVRVVHYRDQHYRPAFRVEHHDFRRGYRWHDGEWRWNRYEWAWTPGFYVRIR